MALPQDSDNLAGYLAPRYEAADVPGLYGLIRAREVLDAFATLFSGGSDMVVLRLHVLRELGLRAEAPRWSPQEIRALFAYLDATKLDTVLLRFRREGLLVWDGEEGWYQLSPVGRTALSALDVLARRALADDVFRADLDARLAAVGLTLLENPYADHLAVGLRREVEDAVFGGMANWLPNNLGLPRDGIALLVVLWALLILPKRERQIARQSLADLPQGDMFGAEKPLPRGEEVAAGLPEVTLVAEFGAHLGGKTRINFNLFSTVGVSWQPWRMSAQDLATLPRRLFSLEIERQFRRR